MLWAVLNFSYFRHCVLPIAGCHKGLYSSQQLQLWQMQLSNAFLQWIQMCFLLQAAHKITLSHHKCCKKKWIILVASISYLFPHHWRRWLSKHSPMKFWKSDHCWKLKQAVGLHCFYWCRRGRKLRQLTQIESKQPFLFYSAQLAHYSLVNSVHFLVKSSQLRTDLSTYVLDYDKLARRNFAVPRPLHNFTTQCVAHCSYQYYTTITIVSRIRT